MKDGAYKILHRLGSGIHSVVWLAESLHTKPRYVSIKIFSCHCDESTINSDILREPDSARVAEFSSSGVRGGLQYVVRTLDRFNTDEHVCVVLELFETSLYTRSVYKRISLISTPPPPISGPTAVSSLCSCAMCHYSIFNIMADTG